MKINPFPRIIKIAGIIVAAAVILQLSGGCGTLLPEGTTNERIKDTYITDLKVTPPSGKSDFELLVTYKFADEGKGRASFISCSYIRPDGVVSDIGEIRPSPDAPGWILDNSGMISNYRALRFTVETSYGPPKPGQYKVRCQTELGYKVAIPFFVEEEKASVPIAEAEVPAAPAEPPKPIETEIQPTPLPELFLKVEINATDVDPPITAVWFGNLTINPDGSVREELSGLITSTTAYSIAGVHAGTYGVNIPFKVDVAGSAEILPSGLKLRIQQTCANYHVDKVSVVEGSLDADALSRIQKGIEEAAPKWLDKIVTGLEFGGTSLPLTQEIAIGAWKGTATLSKGN